jgi:hypothetical protein
VFTPKIGILSRMMKNIPLSKANLQQVTATVLEEFRF